LLLHRWQQRLPLQMQCVGVQKADACA
jgi:hypothetical protein